VYGRQFGNVFIGVQPTFGYEGDPMRLLFSKSASPTTGSPPTTRSWSGSSRPTRCCTSGPTGPSSSCLGSRSAPCLPLPPFPGPSCLPLPQCNSLALVLSCGAHLLQAAGS